MDANVHKIVSHLWEALDTPVSLACYLQAKYGEWDQLAQRRPDPSLYLHSERYFRDAQAIEILRKANFLPLKTDRKKAAFEEFFKCEALCCESNVRLDRWISYPTFESARDHRLYDFIQGVKRRIRSILGPLPDEIRGRFGKGTTFETRGDVTLGEKIQHGLTCTSESVDLLPFIERTAWGRSLREDNQWLISVVPGNRFTTVPKDAVKDRGICVEPGVNIFLQLGVGAHIRARLKRVGVDLDEGQLKHRRLAEQGSRDGTLATIDLSSASDTICTNLVRLVLPSVWYSLLDSLRCKKTYINGNWHWNQKFSSMGNGFTFELESLIFYAISKEACSRATRHVVSVYGDDIIVPNAEFDNVVWALRYFGFHPNPRKSFGTGYFRESCGGDFFAGHDVRPFFLKECPYEPADWISFHNGLVRLGRPDVTRRATKEIRARIPVPIRHCTGGRHLGDLVLHHGRPPITKVIEGCRHVRAWLPIPRYRRLSRYRPSVQLALALYGVPSTGVQPRDSVAGYKIGWVSDPPVGLGWEAVFSERD